MSGETENGMDKIVDLGAARVRRSEPEPEFVRKDEYGRPLYIFLADYRVGVQAHSIDVWAYNETDARAKIAGMRESLVFEGGPLKSRAPA